MRNPAYFPAGFILLFISFASTAQTLKDFQYLKDPYGGSWYLGVGPRYTHLSNPDVPRASYHSVGAWGADFNFKFHSFCKGGIRYTINYNLIADLLFILHDMTSGTGRSYYRGEFTGLSTGVLGWHTMGKNIIAQDKYCIALALNINDYFYASSYTDDSIPGHELVTREPEGYYLAAGPSMMADYLISKSFLLHVKADYSMAYAKPVDVSYAIVDHTYPKPHFFHFSTELTCPWGLFVELGYARIINRGNNPNSGTRTDLLLGFKFVM